MYLSSREGTIYGSIYQCIQVFQPLRSNAIPTPRHEQPVNVTPVTTADRLKQKQQHTPQRDPRQMLSSASCCTKGRNVSLALVYCRWENTSHHPQEWSMQHGFACQAKIVHFSLELLGPVPAASSSVGPKPAPNEVNKSFSSDIPRGCLRPQVTMNAVPRGWRSRWTFGGQSWPSRTKH